ncbi:MAG: Lrp/AsnC family transcriptional regulator [Candidatus Dormibacteria bacterium]
MAIRNDGGSEPAVDQIDRKLLGVLRDDGRLSVAALADRCSISRANAYNRLERLSDSGVIRGFSVQVDSEKIGLGITAVVLLSFQQGDWKTFRDTLAGVPEVEYCALTTGPHDALILVRMADMHRLRDFVLETIQSLPFVRNSETILTLEEVVHRPFVIP